MNLVSFCTNVIPYKRISNIINYAYVTYLLVQYDIINSLAACVLVLSSVYNYSKILITIIINIKQLFWFVVITNNP